MPNNEQSRRALTEARTSLAEADSRKRRLTREAKDSAAAIAALLQRHAPDDQQVVRRQAEHARLVADLEDARAQVSDAKRALNDRLTGWLEPAVAIPDEVAAAAAEVARLPATFPIALFPVRIETRFLRDGARPELRVRIYPDTISANRHDPLLTAEELALGQAYWQQAWSGEEAGAWRELLVDATPQRAAWIVRTTEPTNLTARPSGQPHFPDVGLRADSWDIAPEAPLLPDRWIVLAYRQGHVIRRGVSRPVQQPLSLGFDPNSPPEEGVDVSGDGLVLDDEFLWTIEFTRAVETGMAVRVSIDGDDVQLGFDRVVVLGIRSSLTAEESETQLAQLFDAHHYTEGLALVAQGTATNNTDASNTPYPPPDLDGAVSFAVERGLPLDVEEGDGVRLMRALGLARTTVSHVAGADGEEQVRARAMNQALWPATWGYFLQQMMAPHLTEAGIADTRKHFVDHVRGRGPLPAIRVGAQPYGVLPITSLDRWQPRADAAGVDRQLPPLLRRLRDLWLGQVDQVPRVGLTQDPDADLLAVLGMDASTREVRVRRAQGLDFHLNLLNFIGIDATAWQENQTLIAFPSMMAIGFPAFRPRILGMTFADRTGRFRHPLVAPAPLSEDAGLAAAFGFDYVQWVREAGIQILRGETMAAGQTKPTALLYQMLRHARLAELQRVAVNVQVVHGVLTDAARFEPELVGVADRTAPQSTIWEQLDKPIAGVTGNLTLGNFLVGNPQTPPEAVTLQQYDEALAALEGVSTGELDRLFSETLDLCSHRVDAWITSLATARLAEIREANPVGVHIGAFGWVEDLRAESSTGFSTQTLADGRAVRVPATNAGYIQAPSMQHASAAAILRNGHLTRSGEAGLPYAIDLSSGRVRDGLALLDAAREGQPLGAALGYQFERALHDRGLDWFIDPLRRRFPLVANKAGDPALAGPPDAVAARSVVDGLLLRNGWRDGALDLGHPDFSREGTLPTDAEKNAVSAEIARLDRHLDATADLLTAEAVYQIVGGNIGGANASLDSVAMGARPPEPEVVRPPRTGIPLMHRVAIVLGGDPVQAPGWDAEPSPRSRAEPFVDGWAGLLMGDPGGVACRVHVRRLAGAPQTDTVTVTLGALRLRPIDLLSIARAAAVGEGPLSELDRRVADAALDQAPGGAMVDSISYARDDAAAPDERSFSDVLAIARSINDLLANARPLAPADFVTPAKRPTLTTDASVDQPTLTRATKARERLSGLADSLGAALSAANAASIRTHLRAAGQFGIADAFAAAADRDGPSASIRADAVLAEARRRVEEAGQAGDAVSIAKAVFGSDFPFVPRFKPPMPEETGRALSLMSSIVPEPRDVSRWIYQASRVRPALSRWRTLELVAGTLQTRAGSLDVLQLPTRPGGQWIALPFDPDLPESDPKFPGAGTLSIVLHRVAAPAADKPWAGLLLDEWDEVIPQKELTTGVTFHFDSPGSEPAQAVLLAIPPENADMWSFDALVATLNETLDLAKIRAVDGERLGVLGQLAPAIYLAGNLQDDTVSTHFSDLVAEPLVVREDL
jgi:hypothetical protein